MSDEPRAPRTVAAVWGQLLAYDPEDGVPPCWENVSAPEHRGMDLWAIELLQGDGTRVALIEVTPR